MILWGFLLCFLFQRLRLAYCSATITGKWCSCYAVVFFLIWSKSTLCFCFWFVGVEVMVDCCLYGLSKSLFLSINRSVSKVHDEWFANEEKVRKAVGFLEKTVEYPSAIEVSIFHIGRRLKLFVFCLALTCYWCFGAPIKCMWISNFIFLFFDSWLVGFVLKPILAIRFILLFVVILSVIHVGEVWSGISFLLVSWCSYISGLNLGVKTIVSSRSINTTENVQTSADDCCGIDFSSLCY